MPSIRATSSDRAIRRFQISPVPGSLRGISPSPPRARRPIRSPRRSGGAPSASMSQSISSVARLRSIIARGACATSKAAPVCRATSLATRSTRRSSSRRVVLAGLRIFSIRLAGYCLPACGTAISTGIEEGSRQVSANAGSAAVPGIVPPVRPGDSLFGNECVTTLLLPALFHCVKAGQHRNRTRLLTSNRV